MGCQVDFFGGGNKSLKRLEIMGVLGIGMDGSWELLIGMGFGKSSGNWYGFR